MLYVSLCLVEAAVWSGGVCIVVVSVAFGVGKSLLIDLIRDDSRNAFRQPSTEWDERVDVPASEPQLEARASLSISCLFLRFPSEVLENDSTAVELPLPFHSSISSISFHVFRDRGNAYVAFP